MMEKMDADEINEEEEHNDDMQSAQSAGGDALEYDESAYVMYHRAQTGVLDPGLVDANCYAKL